MGRGRGGEKRSINRKTTAEILRAFSFYVYPSTVGTVWHKYNVTNVRYEPPRCRPIGHRYVQFERKWWFYVNGVGDRRERGNNTVKKGEVLLKYRRERTGNDRIWRVYDEYVNRVVYFRFATHFGFSWRRKTRRALKREIQRPRH